MNKCFLLNPEKISQTRLVVYEKTQKPLNSTRTSKSEKHDILLLSKLSKFRKFFSSIGIRNISSVWEKNDVTEPKARLL